MRLLSTCRVRALSNTKLHSSTTTSSSSKPSILWSSSHSPNSSSSLTSRSSSSRSTRMLSQQLCLLLCRSAGYAAPAVAVVVTQLPRATAAPVQARPGPTLACWPL
jgi:hypothetical protein